VVDIVNTLATLNFSSVNTVLMVITFAALQFLFRQINVLFSILNKQGRSIAFIKGMLNLEEQD